MKNTTNPNLIDYMKEPAKKEGMRKAINAMCKQCIYDPYAKGLGTWVQQVRDCTNATCPLYPYRPGAEKQPPFGNADSYPIPTYRAVPSKALEIEKRPDSGANSTPATRDAVKRINAEHDRRGDKIVEEITEEVRVLKALQCHAHIEQVTALLRPEDDAINAGEATEEKEV